MSTPLLELCDCTVRDRRGEALISRVSLRLHPQERIGIIGESGSGKTMTIKALLNILPSGLTMDAQTLRLSNTDLLRASKETKRSLIGRQIGFVPQNTSAWLHPLLKIRDQITDGFLALHCGSKKEALEKARSLLEAVGFPDAQRVLDSYPAQLSGGMRQRVNIAAALMCGPQLILADEPTAALDSIVQKQVTDLFFELSQNRQAALLIISHNLMMLRRCCDRILVMYAGQIVESGPAEAVFTHPLHPYTQALMAVMPQLDQDSSQPLMEIPGLVPERKRDRQSCLFADRCRWASEACRRPLPAMADEDHAARCLMQRGGEIK